MVISVKNQSFNPVYFAPPLTGFPLELGIGTMGKKLEWWAIKPKKKFDDIFVTADTIHERDSHTNGGRKPGDSTDCAYA